MTKISKIRAREILDSRGNPTVEVDLHLDSGHWGRASVPSGASTGEHEAIELRDADPKRYGGKGVCRAVHHVNQELNSVLADSPLLSQPAWDQRLCELDGSANKSRLGANALLGVSLAYARAVSSERKQPLYHYIGELIGLSRPATLPVPMMNILNGGAHADNNVDLQEFMIMPLNYKCFYNALRAGVEVFHALKAVLKSRGLNTSVGDEGGFAPDLSSNEEAIEVILEAIQSAGYQPGRDIVLALDAASSEFYRDGSYQLPQVKAGGLSRQELCDYYEGLCRRYPIKSIEDGFDQDDWKGWALVTERLGSEVQLVGDDLFVTNTQRLSQGIEKKIANSILIKLNQIGTLTETIAAIQMARKAGYSAVISHRSGETEDTTIADLAVGSGAGQIKTGSLCRTDRLCKYNQLLRIEESLGEHATYLGPRCLG